MTNDEIKAKIYGPKITPEEVLAKFAAMPNDERLAKIVGSTTALVHSLGLKVVAEGVENRAAWELLAEAGCDIAQGFYLARPMGFTDLSAWLAAGAVPQGDTSSRMAPGFSNE